MKADSKRSSKKWPVKRLLLLSALLILLTGGFYLSRNFNQLISAALLTSFNKSIISDVYELTFEHLQVNLFTGNIRVSNVSVLPREKPLKSYPYINSAFRLNAGHFLLEEVEIKTLLRENRLIVNNVAIVNASIWFELNGVHHIMLPFNETDTVSSKMVSGKRPIASFTLNNFELKHANFHSINSHRQREFSVNDLNFSINDLNLTQLKEEYVATFGEVNVTVKSMQGELYNEPIKHLAISDFEMKLDTLNIEQTLDTVAYRFHDLRSQFHHLDIQTKDSLHQIKLRALKLWYKNKSIALNGISFKPNVTHATLQKKYTFQHTELSGSIGIVNLTGVNFDSLLHDQKLFINKVELDTVHAEIFKDKTKPIDSIRTPLYLGQKLKKIPFPFRINQLTARMINLENEERKSDKTIAKVSILGGGMEMKNITNLETKGNLFVRAEAAIEGKIKFKTRLAFRYDKPAFSFEGSMDKFSLPDLNPLIQAYTPAKIKKGTADEVRFKGVANTATAFGTMRFLYHGLEIDLELENQARWKNSIVAFAANTVINANNPNYQGNVPREVTFNVQRDKNKGFVNVIIKSVLNGLKETMVMNKENRKAFRKSKRNTK